MKSIQEVISGYSQKNTAIQKQLDILKVVSDQLEIPIPVIRKGILYQNLLKINGKPVARTEIMIRSGITISYDEKHIHIQRDSEHSISKFELMLKALQNELKFNYLTDINPEYIGVFCCYIGEFCSLDSKNIDDYEKSDSYEEIDKIIDKYYRETNINKEISKQYKRSKSLNDLVLVRVSTITSLKKIVNDLKNDIFSSQLYRFLQEYNKIVTSTAFLKILAPIINSSIYGKNSIELLIKPVNDAVIIKELDRKYDLFEASISSFEKYRALLDKREDILASIYVSLSDKLLDMLRKRCDVEERKSANLLITAHSRKYNFTFPRDNYDLVLKIANDGEGLARDIYIENLDSNFKLEKHHVGILKPGESRDIILSTSLNESDFSPVIELVCHWADNTNLSAERVNKIYFEIQDKEVPWEDLHKNKPYTIQEIEDRNKLYGRDDILEELKSNILSNRIESYKIWGQKRVGKSSIVKTLKNLLRSEEYIIAVWRNIAGLKNTNPIYTLNTLGEALCSEIIEEIDEKIQSDLLKEKLRSVFLPEFDGSLYPLEVFIKKLNNIDKRLKFIFILDEFDRVNDEFFLPGEIGETFSLNIGKGLNEKGNVGFILVGSENMHLLDRQGINYNSFLEREIDTFDKVRDFASFSNIVTGPVDPYLIYSPESIELIYEATNGNPYFANLICSYIFKDSYRNKDYEIDANLASKAIDLIVNSSQKSHFEHFWGDGLTDESNVKKEKKADIRRRILVSFSHLYNKNADFSTKSEIIRNFSFPKEYSVEGFEIENTLNEFFLRKIFYDDAEKKVRVKPLIFEKWLCGPGRTLMIEGISDLEALKREQELEQEYKLKDDEITRICETYKFKEKNILFADVVKYFKQFGDATSQRRIFRIVDSIYYVSKSEIMDFFRSEQKNIFFNKVLELKMGARTIIRDKVEILSFEETLEENKDVVEIFKVLSHIRSQKTLKDIKLFNPVKNKDVEEIIVFVSVITSFSEFSERLNTLLSDSINPNKISIKLLCLIITSKAKADIIKATSSIPHFKLIFFKDVQEFKIKPFVSPSEIFESIEESSYSLYEVKKQFSETQIESLNVVFETHCPEKSLPILWCNNSQFKSLFHNPHGKIINIDKGESNRDRIYYANKDIEQAILKYLERYFINKAKLDNEVEWLTVKYIPKSVLMDVQKRQVEENQVHPVKTYFDFHHYGLIIKSDPQLIKKFTHPTEGLKWCEKLNTLRRDPAHPTKPAPIDDDVIYIEKMREFIVKMTD